MPVNIWMPNYLGDYYNITNHLDCAQHGALKLLIEWQWSKGRSLSDNLDELITITRLRPFFVDASSISQESLLHTRSIRKASDSDAQIHMRAWLLDILSEFFERQPDGRWRHVEYWDRRKTWLEKQETFHARALAGAKARWAGHTAKRPSHVDASSIPSAELKQSPLSLSGKNRSKYQRTSGAGSGRSSARSGPSSTGGSAKTSRPAGSPPPGASAGTPARRTAKGATLPTPPPSPSRPSSTARKSVATDLKSGVRPVKPVTPPDNRFGAFKDEIFRYWDRIRGVQIKAGLIDPLIVPALPSWGTRDRVELNALLVANPEMNVKAFMGLLMNRAKSEDVVHFDHPYRWIKSLMMFAAGPVDRFNKKPRR